MDAATFMASAAMPVMDLPQRKRRVATYGKAARSAPYGLQHVDASPEKSKPSSFDSSLQATKGQKSQSTRPAMGKLVRPAAKRAATTSSIYDVSSSDNESMPVNRTPPRTRASPMPRSRKTTRLTSAEVTSSEQERGSDSSALSRKRKRGAPAPKHDETAAKRQMEDVTSVGGMAVGLKITRAVEVSPQAQNRGVSMPASPLPDAPEVPLDEPTALKKPRRTTARADHGKPAIAKGRSAPAQLHDMLPDPGVSPESTSGGQTPLPSTPSTPPKSAGNGRESVTPRQKDFWSKLMASSSTSESSGSPTTLRVENLRIADGRNTQKPTLRRSSSDLPQTAYTRRVRLIDSLIQSRPVEEEKDEDSEEDEMEVEAEVISQSKEVESSATSQNTASHTAVMVNGGPKVTYARSRSYLTDSNAEAELLFNLPIESPVRPIPVKERSKPGRTASRPQSQLDDEEEEEDSQGKMRSVHELRAAGGNKRFIDDMENLFTDLEDQSASATSRRRSAMLELCAKLAEKGYVGRMIDHGFDRRLFNAGVKVLDPILGSATAAAIAFVANAGAPINILQNIHASGSFKALIPLLDRDEDITRIAQERRTNMSKVAQSSLSGFRSLVQDASIWTMDKPQTLSPRTLALKAIELVVRRLRELGSADELLDQEILSKLLDIAESNSLVDGGISGDINQLELPLSIMESDSSIPIYPFGSMIWSFKALDRLPSLIGPLFGIRCTQLEPVESLALRLCLNLTNNNAKTCDIFAKQTLILPLTASIDVKFGLLAEAMVEDDHVSILDRLILALGAMINLAEFSDKARLSVMADGDGLLSGLVKSFLEGLERAEEADSMEESHSNVAYGYLVVLLGNLCQNPLVRDKVRRKLPGERLDVLLHAVEEFIQYHQKVDKEAFDGEEGGEVWINFTARLQAVVDRLKQAGA